jgi:hypothetical protein
MRTIALCIVCLSLGGCMTTEDRHALGARLRAGGASLQDRPVANQPSPAADNGFSKLCTVREAGIYQQVRCQ